MTVARVGMHNLFIMKTSCDAKWKWCNGRIWNLSWSRRVRPSAIWRIKRNALRNEKDIFKKMPTLICIYLHSDKMLLIDSNATQKGFNDSNRNSSAFWIENVERKKKHCLTVTAVDVAWCSLLEWMYVRHTSIENTFVELFPLQRFITLAHTQSNTREWTPLNWCYFQLPIRYTNIKMYVIYRLFFFLSYYRDIWYSLPTSNTYYMCNWTLLQHTVHRVRNKRQMNTQHTLKYILCSWEFSIIAMKNVRREKF